MLLIKNGTFDKLCSPGSDAVRGYQLHRRKPKYRYWHMYSSAQLKRNYIEEIKNIIVSVGVRRWLPVVRRLHPSAKMLTISAMTQ